MGPVNVPPPTHTADGSRASPHRISNTFSAAVTFRYKAFQLKFCPMVVNRAMTLNCDPSARPKGYWLHALLAPFYSMGA